MFKLLRRISGSITGRLDREWNDDATSNAPQIGRKRRMSDVDEPFASVSSKRARATPDVNEEEGDTSLSSHPSSPPAKETEDVKAVTKGVKEVKLQDEEGELPKDTSVSEEVKAPASSDPIAKLKEEEDPAVETPSQELPTSTKGPVSEDSAEEETSEKESAVPILPETGITKDDSAPSGPAAVSEEPEQGPSGSSPPDPKEDSDSVGEGGEDAEGEDEAPTEVTEDAEKAL